MQRRLRFQCSPFHTSVPLYPFLEQLERRAGFGKEDSARQKLEKLEAVVADAELSLDDALPLLAPLFAVDTPGSYPAINFSPQQQQAKITSALCDLALSGEQPVLIFFEDVHWIDPTSQKVLQHLL
ncbi:MAG: AAA family ATPase, partial [bacterium]